MNVVARSMVLALAANLGLAGLVACSKSTPITAPAITAATTVLAVTTTAVGVPVTGFDRNNCAIAAETNLIDAQKMEPAEASVRFADARRTYTGFLADTADPRLLAAFSAILSDLNTAGSLALLGTKYAADVATLKALCGS